MEITTPLCSSDYELFKGIIEQGIDAHLEAFTESKFEEKLVNGQPRLVMDFKGKDLDILIRRLQEVADFDGNGNEEAESWAIDIQNEVEEMRNLKLNP